MQINREELAWAAGFFDGEGCTSLHRGNPRSPRPVISIGQVGTECLERFKAAVFGIGNILPRQSKCKPEPGAYVYVAARFVEVQAVICLLWNYLSTPKRRQALHALRTYRKTKRFTIRNYKAISNAVTTVTLQ